MTRSSRSWTGIPAAGLLLLLACVEPKAGPAVSPLGPSALVVEPAEVAVTAGRSADFKARTADGSRPAVTWEVQGAGTIDASGHYAAPAAAGVYEIVAKAPGRTASAKVRVVAPPKGPVTGPARALPGARGLKASVPAQPGATYQWTVEGGALVGDARGSSVVFNAGEGPAVILACRVVNAAGTALKASLELALGEQVLLSIEPASAVVTAGARFKIGFTLEGGHTGGVAWKVLEPGGGSVDAAGAYRAPATPGQYTVRGTAQDDPGVKATLAVKVVAAPTGPLRGPSRITAGQKGLKAGIPEQPGCTYAWTVTGGAITAGGNEPRVTFDAGDGPQVRLDCVVTNEAGDAFKGTLTAPVVK